MNKVHIFNDIVSVMQNDSSTIKDIAGPDPDLYRSRIHDDMTDEEFVYAVKCYLAGFGVVSHVSFGSKREPARGYRLRKQDGKLYVVEAVPSSNLHKADEIVAINGIDIQSYYDSHQDFFVSRKEERVS